MLIFPSKPATDMIGKQLKTIHFRFVFDVQNYSCTHTAIGYEMS